MKSCWLPKATAFEVLLVTMNFDCVHAIMLALFIEFSSNHSLHMVSRVDSGICF